MADSPRSAVANAVRTSARIALWSALAITALAAWLVDRYSKPATPEAFRRAQSDQELWRGVDFLAQPEVRLLREYVRIDTSHPDPNEVAGAEFLAAQLAAAGIPATIERFSDRRANLWAFVEGDDPRALVLLGHLDVEPAQEQQGWKFPPFGGVVEGPWIYGRGMYDMKSLAIAQLLATIDAARAGVRPKRSLLFLQTSSEESGGDTGTQWILDHHPELRARLGTVLTEGGVVEAVNPSDIKYWGIEFGQKQFARRTACSSDRRSLELLARWIRDHGRGDPIADVHPAVTRFLAAYSSTRGVSRYRKLLVDPTGLPGDAVRFGKLTPFMQALFRNEATTLPIRPAAAGGWELDIWLHLLPGQDLEAVAAELLPPALFAGVGTTSLRSEGASEPSPLDHADYRVLERAIGESYPGVAVGPYFLPWTMTDARRFRALGLPTYGFAPFPVVVFDTVQIGKANERMQLPAFVAGVDLFRRTVGELIR